MRQIKIADQETIEGQILYMIDRVSAGAKLHSELAEELNSNRSRLRNLIMIYRGHRTQPEIDDLIAAIIADQVLDRDDIQLAFDLNETRYDECIQRLRTERK